MMATIFACQTADDAEPGNAETYIKLIGSEFQDEPAQLLEVTTPTGANDGVVVLGTSENEPLSSFKIRLTRLDNNGNTLWERTYPEEDSAAFSYKARSMIAMNDGYFIVGDSIRNEIEEEDGGEEEEDEARSGLLIMKVDLDGVPVNNMMRTLDIEDADVQGRGITVNQDGDITAVSQIISEDVPNDILLTTFSQNDLSVLCNEQYAARGITTLSSFLLTDPIGNYAFSGTIIDEGLQNVLPFIIPSRCGAIPLSVPELVETSQDNYVGSQIINTLDGFALIGTTDSGLKPNIFVSFLNFSAEADTILIYDNLGISDDEETDEEEGLTIANTNDGGFIISGSTRSNTDAGETNIILIKVDSDGNVQWTSIIGDLNEEEGTFVIQAADGGYYVLGSTEFGGLDTIIVIKTDSEGNVE